MAASIELLPAPAGPAPAHRGVLRSPSRRLGTLGVGARWVIAVALGAAGEAHALTLEPTHPSSVYVQFSAAKDRTDALAVGWTRDWAWQRQYSAGTVGGYWEAALGRWTTGRAEQRASAWVTQVGVTPVLRWTPGDGSGGWFVEGGIGVHVLAPIYRKPNKRFSTTLNFGDHLAVGVRFGADRRDEIALRLQHFSNAGIRQPNPGENFLQLRYSRRF